MRARLGNPDGSLRPGMFARTRIVFAVREKALVVPEEALVPLDRDPVPNRYSELVRKYYEELGKDK